MTAFEPDPELRRILASVDVKRWTRDAEALALYHDALAASSRQYIKDLVDGLYPDEAAKAQP